MISNLVAEGKIDIKASRVTYTTLDYAFYANVDDDTGFNGYALTFRALGDDSGVTLRAADLVKNKTSIEIDQSNVYFDQDTLFVNVDNLSALEKDTITVELGFQIVGTAGKDALNGMNGRDLLYGGAGADHLSGGGGADVFYFLAASESQGKSHDVISGFSHKQHDKIDIGEMLSQQMSSQFAFIDTDKFSGTGAAELRYAIKHGDTLIYADIDGNGTTDAMIELTGAHALVGSDFDL
jgi:Ca2+-binding RTX toxin-like protein